jgi:5'(3')-deoxyribonucleotidase
MEQGNIKTQNMAFLFICKNKYIWLSNYVSFSSQFAMLFCMLTKMIGIKIGFVLATDTLKDFQ